MNEDIYLENKLVKLEPLQAKHFDDLTLISSEHPDLLQYSPSLFGTEEKLKPYIKNGVEQRKLGNRYPLVIYDKSNERFIGSSS
ncbi:MAG: hypothetical protein HRT57_00830 [Crocinitomicaceae bacterium]|nr:hypothetical protein [Crocinitomicaceae bacterium]